MFRVCVCGSRFQIVDVMLGRLGVGPPVKAELRPWFNGFRGKIVPSGKPGTLYSYGAFTRPSSSELRITELPIGKWTDDYKEFLLDAMAKEGGSKEPLVSGFKEYHTVTNVHFLLRLSAHGKEVLSVENSTVDDVLAKLRLRSSIQTGNMHLIDAEGRIRKYNSAEEVIDEHMPLRRDMYVKRKERTIAALQHHVNVQQNRARFVGDVIGGGVPLTKASRQDVEAKLSNAGYARLAIDMAGNPSYDYLLNMSLSQLTTDAVQKAHADISSSQSELATVQATSVEAIWARELTAFRDAVVPHLSDDGSGGSSSTSGPAVVKLPRTATKAKAKATK